MIKFENAEVIGWEHAIRGMRNPMNSWDKSDSFFEYDFDSYDAVEERYKTLDIGSNDHDLMMKLAKGGPVHAKYRRMMAVYVDITAPLYWWKEFDTYKVGTVANSCSTMHKIHAKEFELDDFSHEHLFDCRNETRVFGGNPKMIDDLAEEYEYSALDVLCLTMKALNHYRSKFLEASSHIVYGVGPDYEDPVAKDYWWQMIQLLPSSYNQKRTVMMNYEVLAGIYPMRKNHKLDEWRKFCSWIEELPYSEISIGELEDQQ